MKPHHAFDRALRLVTDKFQGMTDQDGEPFVWHCWRVAAGVSGDEARQVAIMHDLVEDTDVTVDQLREVGFAEEVVDGVDRITHRAEDSYAEYIVRVKEHPLARQAKLSDLSDNANLGRVLYREGRIDEDTRRIQRYVLSYQFLTDRIDEVCYRRLMAPLEL